MFAFIVGWTKSWNNPYVTSCLNYHYDSFPDKFKAILMTEVEGKAAEQRNRTVAELFGEVVTKVKAFPTDNGWIILDRHSKRLLYKDIKNENDVDLLCKQNGYLR